MFSLTHFDPLIASRSLLKHPFYQKWSAGELTLGDLRVYAKEYFHLVRRIPGVVARVRDRALAAKPDMVAMIEENMAEETEHVELWKRFAQSLDVSEEELEQYVPSQTVQDAVDALEKTCEGDFESGIAAIYSLERELPEIAQTKKDGLMRFYNLKGKDAHMYFDEHLKEEKHLHVWLSVPVSDEAEQAVKQSIDAQNQVLDGVCQLCGICLTCRKQ